MGQMKRIYEALCESQELEELLNRKPEPKPITPVVHVLTCNGEIVNAFVDKQTALFEMHLTIQGDEHEGLTPADYVLETVPLQTHRFDQ
jgi:hypothetical protein